MTRIGNAGDGRVHPSVLDAAFCSLTHGARWNAGELSIHDSFVAFSASAAGSAGVTVTLGGVRSTSEVVVGN